MCGNFIMHYKGNVASLFLQSRMMTLVAQNLHAAASAYNKQQLMQWPIYYFLSCMHYSPCVLFVFVWRKVPSRRPAFIPWTKIAMRYSMLNFLCVAECLLCFTYSDIGLADTVRQCKIIVFCVQSRIQSRTARGVWRGQGAYIHLFMHLFQVKLHYIWHCTFLGSVIICWIFIFGDKWGHFCSFTMSNMLTKWQTRVHV